MTQTRVLVMNEKDTLSVTTAIADLRDVLLEADPDLVILNEWPRIRDPLAAKMAEKLGYSYGRPKRGGGPVLWRKTRYELRTMRAVRLARGEFVGHLPGRRDRLGPSWATEAILDDLVHADDHYPHQTALIGCHLTAEVQDVRGGGGYKKDRAHFLRVRRHQLEKRNLGRRARMNQRKGRTVYAGGDTNFDGMRLGGFVNCWDGYPGGDLDGRAVSIVYAAKAPKHRPSTYRTHSDHLAVAVTYGGSSS